MVELLEYKDELITPKNSITEKRDTLLFLDQKNEVSADKSKMIRSTDNVSFSTDQGLSEIINPTVMKEHINDENFSKGLTKVIDKFTSKYDSQIDILIILAIFLALILF